MSLFGSMIPTQSDLALMSGVGKLWDEKRISQLAFSILEIIEGADKKVPEEKAYEAARRFAEMLTSQNTITGSPTSGATVNNIGQALHNVITPGTITKKTTLTALRDLSGAIDNSDLALVEDVAGEPLPGLRKAIAGDRGKHVVASIKSLPASGIAVADMAMGYGKDKNVTQAARKQLAQGDLPAKSLGAEAARARRVMATEAADAQQLAARMASVGVTPTTPPPADPASAIQRQVGRLKQRFPGETSPMGFLGIGGGQALTPQPTPPTAYQQMSGPEAEAVLFERPSREALEAKAEAELAADELKAARAGVTDPERRHLIKRLHRSIKSDGTIKDMDKAKRALARATGQDVKTAGRLLKTLGPEQLKMLRTEQGVASLMAGGRSVLSDPGVLLDDIPGAGFLRKGARPDPALRSAVEKGIGRTGLNRFMRGAGRLGGPAILATALFEAVSRAGDLSEMMGIEDYERAAIRADIRRRGNTTAADLLAAADQDALLKRYEARMVPEDLEAAGRFLVHGPTKRLTNNERLIGGGRGLTTEEQQMNNRTVSSLLAGLPGGF